LSVLGPTASLVGLYAERTSNSSGQKPQVIVAQLGARMHYAVPAILQRAGMLSHFFTDFYVGQGSTIAPLAICADLFPSNLLPTGLKSLLGRREESLRGNKVTAFNTLGFRYSRELHKARNEAERVRVYLKFESLFCDSILRHGLPEADAIYAFQGAAAPLFQAGRKHRIINILEQIIAPISIHNKLLKEERNLWPEWEENDLTCDHVSKLKEECRNEEWELADAILAGSSFVAQGLLSLQVASEKIHVVPYGVETGRFYHPCVPWDGRRPLRILFVGNIELRKGPQYLYHALKGSNNGKFQVRMVGPVSVVESARRALGQVAELTGQVPRSETSRHYAWADLFVFPSICEGSAAVTYEALAAGLPVITTPNAGSVVRDGIDGFIVPIRDAYSLAEKIALLRENPDLLAWMSDNARQRGLEFNWDKYQERLVQTICSICNDNY